ncbi:hypothetical protein ACK8OR_15525 [Jannaschia sp. KMU-145]|uniref:hypothetical protein n=1 Tax=Jannaschia halovivens TaxID=3388667 RepID=UPI00396B2FB7
MTLTLPPNDPRIHVFSVSDGPLRLAHQTYLSQLTDPPADALPLETALGASVDATYAEVFAIDDIAPMTLRDYLAQAHDIPADALSADAARLDALSGDVVVLAPRAVDGVATLTPRPELTHIGSYSTAQADDTPVTLPPAAREPRIATPGAATGTPLQQKTIVWIVLGALVLAGLLVAIL